MAQAALGAGVRGIITLELQYDVDTGTLSTAVIKTKQVTNAVDNHTKATGKNLTSMLKWAAGWQVAYGILNAGKQVLGGTIKNIIEMETQLAHVKVVTGATGGALKQMEHQVRRLGMTYGVSSIEVAKATKIYAQQGLTLEKSVALTEVAIRGSLVTGASLEQMVENLTAAQRGYNLQQNETADLLDAWVAVAQKAPVSVDVLSQAYRRAGAAASDLGITTNELNAMIAGLAGTMRLTGQMAGTALTTIFMRMSRGQSIAALRSAGGIESLEEGGEALRSPFEVLSELASRWDTLSGAQQRIVTQQVAGIRRGKEFVSLIKSWDEVQNSLTTSIDASNNAMAASGILVDTTARQWERLKEAVLGVGSAVLSSPALKRTLSDIAGGLEEAQTGGGIDTTEALVRGAFEYGPFVLIPKQIRQLAQRQLDRFFEKEGGEYRGLGRTAEEREAAKERVARTRANVERLERRLAERAIAAGRPIGSFGAGTFGLAEMSRVPNPAIAQFINQLADSLGLSQLTAGGQRQDLKPRDLFRLAGIERMGATGLGAAELAGGGARGANVALEVAKQQREVAAGITAELMRQEDIATKLGENNEARILAEQAIKTEIDAQLKVLTAQQNVVKAIARDIRGAANAYKGAFGTGLKDLIRGEGTVSGIFKGLGETAFERNIDSLVDRMDKVFLSVGRAEQAMIRQGGIEAAAFMKQGIVTGGMQVKALLSGDTTSLAGGTTGVEGQDDILNDILSGGKPGPASASTVTALAAASSFADKFVADALTEQRSEVPSWFANKYPYFAAEKPGLAARIAAMYPAGTGQHTVFQDPDILAEMGLGGGMDPLGSFDLTGAAGPAPDARTPLGMRGKALGGAALMGALQGYSLSGGKIEGALASGLGALAGGAAFGPVGAQIGSLAGALFRDAPDPVETERRYDSRIEWENAVLEQLVLSNRNLVGLKEGGTFALQDSYYYRERVNETLAGSLELALRGS